MIIPLTVTLYVFYQIFLWVDANLGRIVLGLTGLNIPGISFLFLGVLFLLTVLTGMLTTNYIGKKLVSLFEALLAMIPLVRGVYMTIKQVLEVFLVKKESAFREVVLVEFPRKGIYSVGFVTSKIASKFSLPEKDMLIVFIPTTPNPTSGFVVMIPASEVIHVPMSVDQALKLVVSVGILASDIWGDRRNAVEYGEKGKLDSMVTSDTVGR